MGVGAGGGQQEVRFEFHFPQGVMEDIWVGNADDLFRQNRIIMNLTEAE